MEKLVGRALRGKAGPEGCRAPCVRPAGQAGKKDSEATEGTGSGFDWEPPGWGSLDKPSGGASHMGPRKVRLRRWIKCSRCWKDPQSAGIGRKPF